jgi:hypothetical protein
MAASHSSRPSKFKGGNGRPAAERVNAYLVALMMRVLVAAEKVAKYRHAQIAAIRLSGDVNAKVDESTIEELLVKIKEEYKALGPLLDLDVVGEAQGSRTEHRLAAGSRAVEHPGA